MYIAQLDVSNFRGIKSLTWKPSAALNCLIGAGDATKSTILAAIEVALWPSWNLSIDETDCHGLTTQNPILITATIADPPAELLREDVFGFLQRGWSAVGELHDEPAPDDVPALTIRFTLNTDNEPVWHVIADHYPNEKTISARQRALCNMTRVDTIDRQLTWTNGSLLTKATTDQDGAAATFGRAARAAREAFRAEDHPQLTTTANTLQTTAVQFGVRPRGSYKASLDSKAMQLRTGCLSLHDGVVPSRLFGLGTRRILGVALQSMITDAPAILLIDEFEHGLEPHRIRRLLRKLATMTGVQVIMTTHSPVVVHEIASEALTVIRANDQEVTAQTVPTHELQKTVREAPESLLARRILVCEGPTEVGIIRSLDDHWATDTIPMACTGALAIDGGGSVAPTRARKLKQLGYDVMVYMDSDVAAARTAVALRQEGIPVAMYNDTVCTEEALMADLPWTGIIELLRIAMTYHEEQALRDQVKARLPEGTAIDLSAPPNDWPESPELRTALGTTAKEKDWYKQLQLGEAVGAVIAQHLHAMPQTDTATVLETIRAWLHRD